MGSMFTRMLQTVFLVGAFISAVFAQTGTSSITGSVTDATGSAIPGVGITVINQDSGAKLETVSNEAGAYRVASLPPGTYRIEAELPGFNRLSRGPISLVVSETLAIDLQLQVGQVTE